MDKDNVNKDNVIKGVKKGLEFIDKYAKWLKKQKYSEEEVEKIVSAIEDYLDEYVWWE